MGISKNGYRLNEIMLSLKPEMRRRLAKQSVNQKQDVGNVPVSFNSNDYCGGIFRSDKLIGIIQQEADKQIGSLAAAFFNAIKYIDNNK